MVEEPRKTRISRFLNVVHLKNCDNKRINLNLNHLWSGSPRPHVNAKCEHGQSAPHAHLGTAAEIKSEKHYTYNTHIYCTYRRTDTNQNCLLHTKWNRSVFVFGGGGYWVQMTVLFHLFAFFHQSTSPLDWWISPPRTPLTRTPATTEATALRLSPQLTHSHSGQRKLSRNPAIPSTPLLSCWHRWSASSRGAFPSLPFAHGEGCFTFLVEHRKVNDHTCKSMSWSLTPHC